MRVENEELLPIGRFSQLTGVTAKALRHYDDVGLLRPAHVDPWAAAVLSDPGLVREPRRTGSSSSSTA